MIHIVCFVLLIFCISTNMIYGMDARFRSHLEAFGLLSKEEEQGCLSGMNDPIPSSQQILTPEELDRMTQQNPSSLFDNSPTPFFEQDDSSFSDFDDNSPTPFFEQDDSSFSDFDDTSNESEFFFPEYFNNTASSSLNAFASSSFTQNISFNSQQKPEKNSHL